MTPEEREQFNELLAWKKAREAQQLFVPFDDTSRLISGSISSAGAGSTATTQIVNVGSTPTNITVPAAFVGSIIFNTPDGRFEIPYIKAL